jgi:hypothetical protein
MRNAISARVVVNAGLLQAGKVTATAMLIAALLSASKAPAQAQESLAEKIDRLSADAVKVTAQLEQSANELRDLKLEITQLRKQAKLPENSSPTEQPDVSAAKLASAVEEIREKQDMEQTQLAVQEQAKVGSESRYPVTISGLILMNSFVNTRTVDVPSTPSVAYYGSGATGASLRQSIIGINATGPHIFGATSHADVHADFDGGQATNDYSNALGVLRLRTAHAELDWHNSKAFIAYDRPIISPDSPNSLTAVALPALAWSGNLWAWNPQAGVSQTLPLPSAAALQLQVALIDVADPPNPLATSPPNAVTPQTSEQSRWPGVQVRVSLLNAESETGAHIGAGGFFAPHLTPGGWRFNSWATTVDFHMPVFSHLEFEGNAYRGQALGGLGGGAFKDYVYLDYAGDTNLRTLDDMGGWVQARQKVNERLEFNEAFGIDNVPAYQLLPFAIANANSFYNLARNRTFTGNVIFKPSSYLLYSIEYRRIESSPVNVPTAASDVIGIAAGFRF